MCTFETELTHSPSHVGIWLAFSFVEVVDESNTCPHVTTIFNILACFLLDQERLHHWAFVWWYTFNFFRTDMEWVRCANCVHRVMSFLQVFTLALVIQSVWNIEAVSFTFGAFRVVRRLRLEIPTAELMHAWDNYSMNTKASIIYIDVSRCSSGSAFCINSIACYRSGR